LLGCFFGFAIGLLAGVTLIVSLWFFLSRVPETYPTVAHPLDPPVVKERVELGLAGWESPYLGHTGSWDGKGGGMFGSSKVKDLEKELEMGLRWTFMPVSWRALEPNGPVDLAGDVPEAWEALDRFVIEAQMRGLNILMQAPVIGGNAGGPPKWAGRREPRKSAPTNMEAAAAFAGKLAQRYRPGGWLATREGWEMNYGVRAWEIDNEPDSYRTHWKGQAADYAEFATRVATAIRAEDPLAVIVLPGTPIGNHSLEWIDAALDADGFRGSPVVRNRGIPYSIGPIADVVSFHIYEGLDSFFSGEDRTIELAFSEVREIFEKWEDKAPGFEFERKREYWHTEGNYDFLGILSEERRASWRIQFMTRAFAAGVRKVCVMDASPTERVAVRAYLNALPNPFPMFREEEPELVLKGGAIVFRHPDGAQSTDGQVWIAWAKAGGEMAEVALPVHHRKVELIRVDGSVEQHSPIDGRVRISLASDRKMAPPILLIDREGAGGVETGIR